LDSLSDIDLEEVQGEAVEEEVNEEEENEQEEWSEKSADDDSDDEVTDDEYDEGEYQNEPLDVEPLRVWYPNQIVSFNSGDDSHAHDIPTPTADGPVHVYVPPGSQTEKEKTIPFGFPDTGKEKTIPSENEKTSSTVPSSGADSSVNDNDEANYQLMMNMLAAMTEQLSGIKKDSDATKKKLKSETHGIKLSACFYVKIEQLHHPNSHYFPLCSLFIGTFHFR